LGKGAEKKRAGKDAGATRGVRAGPLSGKGGICNRLGSGRRRIFFELLDVAFLDLLHEGFATEKIRLEIGGEPAGHDEKLIVDDFGKRNGAAGGNEMRTPLENEAGVPKSCNGEKDARGGESGGAGAEELSGAIEKGGEAEDEKRRERNEKAVAVGRDAGPIGVTGDKNVEGEEAGKQRSAYERFAATEEEESDDGK